MTAESADAYEYTEYAATSYGSILWAIERRQLQAVVEELRRSSTYVSHLDCAAGTGRVLSFLAPLVNDADAVEISESMAAVARRKVPAATVFVGDVASWSHPDAKRYDIVTLFRFVLNAEPELRLAALMNAARLLRNPSSVLVFNNHGHLFSHKLLSWPLHRAALSRSFAQENFLTDRAVRKLTARAGLEIVASFGCGLVGGRIASRLGIELVSSIERGAAKTWLSNIGVNQMYVARRI